LTGFDRFIIVSRISKVSALKSNDGMEGHGRAPPKPQKRYIVSGQFRFKATPTSAQKVVEDSGNPPNNGRENI